MSPQDEVAIDRAVSQAGNFVEVLNDVILFPLIGLMSAVAFLIFLWGCAQYIMNGDNPSARGDGVQHITWGIIGLVVMMSAWAILSIAAATFGLDDNLDRAKNGQTEGSGTQTFPGVSDGTQTFPGPSGGTQTLPGPSGGTQTPPGSSGI